MPPYRKRKFIRGRQIEVSLHVKGPKKGRVYQLRISNLRDKWAREYDLRPSEDWETVAKTRRFKITRNKKSDIHVLIDRATGHFVVLGEGPKSPGQLRTLYGDYLKRRRYKNVHHEIGVS